MIEKINEIAQRIKGLRQDLGISTDEMAAHAGVAKNEYCEYESGKKDFSFSFLYKISEKLGIDTSELITGASPTLSVYTHVKKGDGLKIERRKGFNYQSLAHLFRNRNAEPFMVEAPYDASSSQTETKQGSHDGQEFDLIIKGSLKVKIDEHEFVMKEGDSVYYDATHPHGMVAAGPEGCTFLAIVIRDRNGRIG